jgi:hypothetical protein
MSRKRRKERTFETIRRPAIIWLLIAVLLFMGTLMMFLTGHVSILTIERNGQEGMVHATLENSFLRLVPLGTTQLNGLKEAKLEVVRDKKNSSSPTFRVLLLADNQVVPMTSFSRGGREHHQSIVDSINYQLKNRAPEQISIKNEGAVWLAYTIAVILLVGIVLRSLLKKVCGEVNHIENYEDGHQYCSIDISIV